MFDIFSLALLAFGALLGGFTVGLTGFGTAITALAFWLYVVPPAVAAPLVAICSIGAHITSVGRVWRMFDFTVAKPFLVGGVFGVPLGIALLDWLDPATFKGLAGILLTGYGVMMLALRNPPVLKTSGPIVDAGVGFGGGVLGGFAGLSGLLPVVWASLRGWSKERQRGVIQGFNMLVLGFAIVLYGATGMLTSEVALAAAICAPATFVGAWAGANAFLAIDARLFRQVVLALVCISGAILTAAWVIA